MSNMITLSDRALDQLLTYETREEQRAFLTGLQWQEDKQETPNQSVIQGSVMPSADRLDYINPDKWNKTIVTPHAAAIPTPPPSRRKPKFTRVNVGAQANILRMLFTGEASANHLLRTLSHPSNIISGAIHKLILKTFIIETAQHTYKLTLLGQQAAQYLVDHPVNKMLPHNWQGK